MTRSSWSSLTRVLWIAARATMVLPCQFEAPRHSVKHSSYVVDGKFIIYYISVDCCRPLHSFSVLPSISLRDGILHCSVVEGSFCTQTFTKFIKRLLDFMQPFPAPNSVIVMEDCMIHKHPEIQELIQAR